MKFEVYADKATKDLTKLYSVLSKPEIDKSIARAINSTLLLTRTQMNRGIRAKYKLSNPQINDGLFIVKSNYSTLTGKILASPKTFPLTTFNPVEIKDGVRTKRIGSKKGSFASSKVSKPTHQGVMLEIIAGQKKVIDSAALIFKGNSNGTVKARGTYSSGFGFNSNDTSKTLSSISIASILKGGAIQADLKQFASTEYERILSSELQKRLRKIA